MESYLTSHPNDTYIISKLGADYATLGQHEKAEQYLRKALSIDSDSPETNYSLGVTLQEQNKLDDAISLLSRLEESAQAFGRQGRLIEIMILKALAMQRMGDDIQTNIAITKSLMLAEPEGYVRIYLDEGGQMEELLQAYSGRAEGAPKAYTEQLLVAFSKTPSNETGISTSPYQPQPLVEPLTQREAEVLGLLAAGLSNREIAEQLVLSEGTIKTHAHNLYGKLGVNSRTQAIVRAKELNLI